MKKTLIQWLILILLVAAVILWYRDENKTEQASGTNETEESQDTSRIEPGTYVVFETSTGGYRTPKKTPSIAFVRLSTPGRLRLQKW